MLSNEERKAIERVELFIDGERQYNTKTGETIIPYEYGESQRFVFKETYYAIQVVLNLIEKQSKEIEELKSRNQEAIEALEEWINGERVSIHCIHKAKIKAKIEPKLKELDEQINEEWKKYGNSKELQDMEDMYNFLQSLLEEE